MLTLNEFRKEFKDELSILGLEYKYNSKKYYAKYKTLRREGLVISMNNFVQDFYLAPLPKAVPCWVGDSPKDYAPACPKQEGKTPMRYNENYASAYANVTTAKSDTAVQRDYLLGRLESAYNEKEAELYRLFNLDVDGAPKTYKELIDAIKGDKFTINKKVERKYNDTVDNEQQWFYGPFHGIEWDGPQPDRKGYEAALNEKQKQFTAAKDIIMTTSDGLKALQDFEAWRPTPGQNTTH